MTVDEFWERVGSTVEPDPYERERRLIQTLTVLPPAEILDFDYWWVQARNLAYKARLWAAVTLINGRWVSDDSFEYFIGWLIRRGRNTFKTVVDDPDSLINPSRTCSVPR